MAVIKVDDKLHKKIKEFIKKEPNRFDFPTVKSFVDKAVYEFLKRKNER